MYYSFGRRGRAPLVERLLEGGLYVTRFLIYRSRYIRYLATRGVGVISTCTRQVAEKIEIRLGGLLNSC